MSRKKKTGGPPPDRARSAPAGWLPALALCALTAVAFSSSFQAGFAWDNQYLILKDPRIRAGTAEHLGQIFGHTYWWPTGEAGLYRPLTTLSYLFNYSILGNGGQPAGYHLVNLILHLGNVLLVYALARALITGLWPPLLLAALWAVHPATTESVTNIVGRADLLSGMAILSGVLLYRRASASAGSRRYVWLGGLMAATAAGVYSKESGVMILAALGLYELAFRRDYRSLLAGLAATLPPIAAMLWQRSAVLAASPAAEWPFTDNPILGVDFWTGRLMAAGVMGRYLWLTIWPAQLSVDYSYAQTGPRSSLVFTALFLIATAGACFLWKWNRTAFFLAGFAFLMLLPASNLLFPIGTIMAERFLYLPLVGLLGLLVLALYNYAPRFATTALCVILAGCTARTWARNLDWKDNLTLATASLAASPDSYKLHKVLASGLFTADPSHTKLDQIDGEIGKTLAILAPLPDELNEADSWRWAGGFLLTKGDLLARQGQAARPSFERARDVLLRCLAISRASEAAYRAKGRPGRARAAYEPEAQRLLATAYVRLGEIPKAMEAARRARTLDPANAESFHVWAEALLATKEPEAAAVALMQGFLVTSDRGLANDLIGLYRGGLDPGGCAVSSGPNSAAMNVNCPIVHRHICAAAAQGDARLKQIGAQQFGCPP